MNIQELKRIKEDFKGYLDYRISMQRKENEFYTFMRHYHEGIVPCSDEWYKLQMTFYHSWNVADRCFRNADAADMLDAKDSITDAIHQLRKKRNETRFPPSYMAYTNAINLMKEALSKLPKRMIRL